MRKIASLLSVAAATLIVTAVPVLADEAIKTDMRMDKDQCLLVAMNCRGQVDSLQQRIDKLQREIARGRDVYTADELSRLNNKLEDAMRTMEVLVENGGA